MTREDSDFSGLLLPLSIQLYDIDECNPFKLLDSSVLQLRN